MKIENLERASRINDELAKLKQKCHSYCGNGQPVPQTGNEHL